MISKFFINRPVLANVLAIVMVLIGGVALFTLPVAQYPNVVPPTVSGHDQLSGRERGYRDEHGGAADRAAGQRRAGHALHAVDQRVRRHVLTDCDLRDRHRPEFCTGPGAESRFCGDGVAAAGGAGAGRHCAAEVHVDSADRHVVLAGWPLRQPVPEQLRHHQSGPGARPRPWRRQCQRIRRRAIFHAHLARSADIEGARTGARGRDQGVQQQSQQVTAGQVGAPPAPAGQAFQYTVNIEGRLADPAEFGNIIVKVDSAEWWPDHPGEGCRACRTGRADLLPDRPD